MSESEVNTRQFVIKLPDDLPYFEVHGHLFHALPATGYELEELEKLKVGEGEQADRAVLRRQVEIMAGILAERAIIPNPGPGQGKSEFIPNPEPPTADFYWKKLPMPQIVELVKAFSQVVNPPKNRAERRKQNN